MNIFFKGSFLNRQTNYFDYECSNKNILNHNSKILPVLDNGFLGFFKNNNFEFFFLSLYEFFEEKNKLIYLGRLDNTNYFAYRSEFDFGYFLDKYRKDFLLKDILNFSLEKISSFSDLSIAAYAKSLVEWNENAVYCSKCSLPLLKKNYTSKKYCKKCSKEFFPRVDPVVVMLVINPNNEVLLARAKNFPVGVYSALAGFVEPGESIEEAVDREVSEEIGLSVTDISYKFSQPWPFSSSLMIGCFAYVSSSDYDLSVDDELDEAIWLNRSKLSLLLEGESNEIILPPDYALAKNLLIEFIQ